ncbi:hypothetical protein BH09PAT2_BH09PAT2_10590 [soil metagenome]
MTPKSEEKPMKAKTVEEKNETAVEAKSTHSDASLNSVLSRLSQQFNLLAILVVALFMFQAYTFYKLKNVETKGTVAGAAGTAQGGSPLSKESLMKYADEIKLDTKKFEQCLDGGSKKSIVEAESKEATSMNVQGTPGFFINGRFLGGAFPFETFKEIIDAEIAGTASNECTGWSQDMQQYCSDPKNLAFNPMPQKINLGNAPSKGAKNPKVTIVEYSDFECPFCHRAFATVEQVMETYPNDVKLVYKQLPLVSIHPNSQRAAEASLCALEQGKFWEMHDAMFKAQTQ